jgi:hypothetical protein
LDFLPRREDVELEALFVFAVMLWLVCDADVDFEAGLEAVADLCVVAVFGLLEVVFEAVESVCANRAAHTSSVLTSSATIFHFPRSIWNPLILKPCCLQTVALP